MAEEVLKLEDELTVLRAEYNKLQEHLSDIEFKYQSELTTTRDQDYNQEEHFALNLQKAVADFFNKPNYSDILFLMEDGREISGHKLIISARTDDWGGTGLNLVDSLDLKDIRYDVAYAMIKWVYTDEINIQEDSLLIELLQAATRLKLDSLHIRCQKEMVSCIDNNNCNTFLKISEKLSCQLLKDYCEDYLLQCKKIVTKEKSPSHNMNMESDNQLNVQVVIDQEGHISKVGAEVNRIPQSTNIMTPGDIDDTSNKSLNGEANLVSLYLKTIDGDKPAHKCDVCDKTFIRKSALDSHKASHEDRNHFKCDVCDKTFIRKSALDSHKTSHEVRNHFKCDVCSNTFKYQSSLKRHKKFHSEENVACVVSTNNSSTQPENSSMQCDVCGKTFRNRHSFNYHKAIHLQRYKCDVCNKIFGRNIALKTHHLTNHLGQKAFKCDVCGKTFSHKSHLKRHGLIHTGEKPYECSVCGKCFRDASTKRNHEKSHSRNNNSSKLQISFKGDQQLNDEEISSRRSKKSSLKCDVCGKTCINRQSLNYHLAIHQQRYKCEICNKIFGRNIALKTHHQIHHLGEKSYLCFVCGKRFTQKRHLQRHGLIHTGEKPYLCNSCGRSFRDATTLRKHETIHSRNESFQCEVCNQLFVIKRDLNKHILTHPKPFRCTTCGLSYGSKRCLRRHQNEIHSGENPHKCDECDKTFKRKLSLNKHKESHSGVFT